MKRSGYRCVQFSRPTVFGLFTALGLLAFASVAFSHMWSDEEFTCPLCAEKFVATVDGSGTSFGQRLDLKPLGLIAAPWRKPVCPKCHLVLYKNKIPKEDLPTLRKIVESAEYKALVQEVQPAYALWAFIRDQRGEDPFEIAWTYIQASWQVEKDPALHRSVLEKALAHLLAFGKAEAYAGHKEWPMAMHLAGEALRLMGRFSEAEDHFLRLQSNRRFLKQPFRSLLNRELELIGQKDSAPRKMPEIVLTEEDKRQRPEYKEAEGLPGFEKMLEKFKIQEVRRGGINGKPRSLNLDLALREPVCIDEVRWWSPLVSGIYESSFDSLRVPNSSLW